MQSCKVAPDINFLASKCWEWRWLLSFLCKEGREDKGHHHHFSLYHTYCVAPTALTKKYVKYLRELEEFSQEGTSCQNTSIMVKLVATMFLFAEPETHIIGEPDMYVDIGSMLNLSCVVSFTERPPIKVSWLHNGIEISFRGPRNGVSVSWKWLNFPQLFSSFSPHPLWFLEEALEWKHLLLCSSPFSSSSSTLQNYKDCRYGFDSGFSTAVVQQIARRR